MVPGWRSPDFLTVVAGVVTGRGTEPEGWDPFGLGVAATESEEAPVGGFWSSSNCIWNRYWNWFNFHKKY